MLLAATVMAGEINNSHDYPPPPNPHTFHMKNNLSDWLSWNYPDYRWLYCTNGHWIPGEKNVLIGSLYIAVYFLFLSLYIHSLLVMASRSSAMPVIS